MYMNDPALNKKEKLYKRPFDIAFVVFCLVLPPLIPVWILLWTFIPLAIWLEDRGPIFFIQERYGRGGKRFGLIKFRSMKVPSKGEIWSPFTATNDSRITRVGKILQRTALDELPQLLNIIKGDISFVGPRALATQMHDQYTEEEPRFYKRLIVRPGLTGLAQVRLPRHCSPRKRLLYDLAYIRRANVVLDLSLIWISVWLSLTGRWGAGPRKAEIESVPVHSKG